MLVARIWIVNAVILLNMILFLIEVVLRKMIVKLFNVLLTLLRGVEKSVNLNIIVFKEHVKM